MAEKHDEILKQAAEFIKEHDLEKLKIKGTDGEKFKFEANAGEEESIEEE